MFGASGVMARFPVFLFKSMYNKGNKRMTPIKEGG